MPCLVQMLCESGSAIVKCLTGNCKSTMTCEHQKSTAVQGADAPESGLNRFESDWVTVYGASSTSNLANLTWYQIVGNHDIGFGELNTLKPQLWTGELQVMPEASKQHLVMCLCVLFTCRQCGSPGSLHPEQQQVSCASACPLTSAGCHAFMTALRTVCACVHSFAVQQAQPLISKA